MKDDEKQKIRDLIESEKFKYEANKTDYLYYSSLVNNGGILVVAILTIIMVMLPYYNYKEIVPLVLILVITIVSVFILMEVSKADKKKNKFEKDLIQNRDKIYDLYKQILK